MTGPDHTDGRRPSVAINYDLLKRLAEKPHPLLNIADDFEEQAAAEIEAPARELSAATGRHAGETGGGT